MMKAHFPIRFMALLEPRVLFMQALEVMKALWSFEA